MYQSIHPDPARTIYVYGALREYNREDAFYLMVSIQARCCADESDVDGSQAGNAVGHCSTWDEFEKNQGGRCSSNGRLIKSGSNSYLISPDIPLKGAVYDSPRYTVHLHIDVSSVQNALDTTISTRIHTDKRETHFNEGRGKVPSLYCP